MFTFRCVYRTKATARSFLRAVSFCNESGCWSSPSGAPAAPKATVRPFCTQAVTPFHRRLFKRKICGNLPADGFQLPAASSICRKFSQEIQEPGSQGFRKHARLKLLTLLCLLSPRTHTQAAENTHTHTHSNRKEGSLLLQSCFCCWSFTPI